MQRFVLLMLAGILIHADASARQLNIGHWKNFTAMKSVVSAVSSGGSLWVATSGGVFAYDVRTGKIDRMTISEGLSSNDCGAIGVDRLSRIWIGASDGSIAVYDPATGGWSSITDIRESNRLQKGVQSFFSRGDSMFVVCGYGISVFLLNRWEFGDTYANFGFATQPLVHRMLLQGNRVWVATDQGIATALLSAPNLSSPASWTLYTGPGLPSSTILSLALFRDTLVVGATSGAAFFSNGAFSVIGSMNGKIIADLAPGTTELLALSVGLGTLQLESLASLNTSSQILATNASAQGTVIVKDPVSSQPWVGTMTSGIVQWQSGQWTSVYPNGPSSNLFVSLAIDADGILWAGTGANGGGRGFVRYNPSLPEGSRWKNFTLSDYPIMYHNDYYKVSTGANGSVWASSWGEGILEVAGDTIRRRIDSRMTPGLSPTVVDPNFPYFTVAGGVVVDRKGTSWIVDRTAVNGRYLAQTVNDSTIAYYRNLYDPSEGVFSNVVIDGNGTKWLANSEPFIKSDRGLFYFNEDLSVSGTESTGGWGRMTISEGLPNSSVLSLAVDLNGEVWVGSDLGALILTDPLFPKSRRAIVFPLREQSVQAIAVDAVNNKWVGTREGVFVLNPDGTQLLQQYNVFLTKGQLADNDVRSIAIDQRRGIVYVGTQKGLSSLEISAVQTERSYSTLEFGPNPYILPSNDPLTIRNLVPSSSIKILTISGSLVAQFNAQGGGRAFWDGRDMEGRVVSSGVYLVVAFAENGNQVATGKIAVVRR
ncbi:MAG: hypothetical protein WBD36_02135 [Bacteroidota bacterium]